MRAFALVPTVLWLALPLAARADGSDSASRAVAEVNGEVGVSYSYVELDEQRFPMFFSGRPLIPKQESRGAAGYGRLTVPVGDFLGLRLRARGGVTHSEVEFFGLTFESEASFADVNAELFWRDPHLGSVDVGYHYSWIEGSFDPSDHGLTVSAALFFPDLGVGEVDLAVDFEWVRSEIPLGFRTYDADAFAVSVGPRWYAADRLMIEPSFLWARSSLRERDFDTSESLEGRLALEGLLGGKRKYVSLGLSSSYGQLTTPVGFFGDATRRTWGIGGSVTFYLGGLESLRELVRERR